MEDKWLEDQENKLKTLRKRWLEATYRKEKDFIERQAKLLKTAIRLHKENMDGDKQLQKDAETIFGY